MEQAEYLITSVFRIGQVTMTVGEPVRHVERAIADPPDKRSTRPRRAPSRRAEIDDGLLGIALLAGSNAKASVVTKPLSPQTLTRRCGLFVREDSRHPALKSFIDLLLEKTAPWRTAR